MGFMFPNFQKTSQALSKYRCRKSAKPQNRHIRQYIHYFSDVLSYYFDFGGVEILQLSKIIKVQAKK